MTGSDHVFARQLNALFARSAVRTTNTMLAQALTDQGLPDFGSESFSTSQRCPNATSTAIRRTDRRVLRSAALVLLRLALRAQ